MFLVVVVYNKKKIDMSDYQDKTNNEILLEIKELQYIHEALKAKIIKEYDELIVIENRFKAANEEMTKRLKL